MKDQNTRLSEKLEVVHSNNEGTGCGCGCDECKCVVGCTCGNCGCGCADCHCG